MLRTGWKLQVGGGVKLAENAWMPVFCTRDATFLSRNEAEMKCSRDSAAGAEKMGELRIVAVRPSAQNSSGASNTGPLQLTPQHDPQDDEHGQGR